MLKGIPPIVPPELLKLMSEMGHGDEICLADGNFPAASHAQRLVRADGHDVAPMLEAVLGLFPLDTYLERPVSLMAVVPGDPQPDAWKAYEEILKRVPEWPGAFGFVERFEFYERVKRAYVAVATTDTAPYANILLSKGHVTGERLGRTDD